MTEKKRAAARRSRVPEAETSGDAATPEPEGELPAPLVEVVMLATLPGIGVHGELKKLPADDVVHLKEEGAVRPATDTDRRLAAN